MDNSTIIKTIFFDFDGVLAESVSAKTQAFKEIYLPYGEEIAQKVVNHHIHHGGVSRFEKFKIYHKNFLNKDLNEKDIQDLATQFSNLVLQKVINSDEVEGALYFLKKYAKKMQFWIITGTPTNEIEIIAKERGIYKYFMGLHGSPKDKRYWTEFLLKKYKLNRKETIFLGDATTDYDAAQFSNLHFALREHDENITIFKDYKGIRFKDFNEFEKHINPYLS